MSPTRFSILMIWAVMKMLGTVYFLQKGENIKLQVYFKKYKKGKNAEEKGKDNTNGKHLI